MMINCTCTFWRRYKQAYPNVTLNVIVYVYMIIKYVKIKDNNNNNNNKVNYFSKYEGRSLRKENITSANACMNV